MEQRCAISASSTCISADDGKTIGRRIRISVPVRRWAAGADDRGSAYPVWLSLGQLIPSVAVGNLPEELASRVTSFAPSDAVARDGRARASERESGTCFNADLTNLFRLKVAVLCEVKAACRAAPAHSFDRILLLGSC